MVTIREPDRFRNQASPTTYMTNYFTDDHIIEHLCKERVKLASSRNDRQKIPRLTGRLAEAAPSHLFYQLLPARRQWNAYRPRRRSANVNSDLVALKNAVRDLRLQQPGQPWVVALNEYIVNIRERAFGNARFTFARPRINWVLKLSLIHI